MSEQIPEKCLAKPGHFLNILRATMTSDANRTAILYKDQSVTYGELDSQARRWAGRLQQSGIEPGDRVAILTAAKLRFVAAHLGALYASAISLPLNPRSTADELAYYLLDSGARVVIAGNDEGLVVESLRPDLPDLCMILPDVHDWDRPASGFAEQEVDGAEPCLMLYSSGTTGRPKGVVHTHANLDCSLRALQAFWHFTPDDVLVNVLPLFHIHGLSFAAHLSLLTGSCLLLDDAFHPRRTMELLRRGTVFMAIPTFYYSFLEQSQFITVARQWRNVRLFTCGSAPIRAEVLPELEAILRRPVINRYGMTEAHVITSLPLDGPWPQGSVGLPLPGIEVRLQKDDGMPASTGEVGSVALRGPNLFRDYWRKADATQTAFSDGWFDTGDLGSCDSAGFLTLVGRKHDLIITSGFNVYPQVVERVINECPGVRESAVVGVPEKKRGERVVAVVIRSDEALSEKSMRAYVNERLVDYQRPAAYFFAESLPRNVLGKVLRRQLAADLVREL
jgi:malonyl-CoA/methylmalonyl-CoA synthetase